MSAARIAARVIGLTVQPACYAGLAFGLLRALGADVPGWAWIIAMAIGWPVCAVALVITIGIRSHPMPSEPGGAPGTESGP